MHLQRGQTVFADRAGAIAPIPIALAAPQGKVIAHFPSPKLRGLSRAKQKCPVPGRGNEAKGYSRSSCPPRTGRELAPPTRNILVRLSWRRRARAPQPLCMKSIRATAARMNNGIYGANHSSSLKVLAARAHGAFRRDAGRTGSGDRTGLCWPHRALMLPPHSARSTAHREFCKTPRFARESVAVEKGHPPPGSFSVTAHSRRL